MSQNSNNLLKDYLTNFKVKVLVELQQGISLPCFTEDNIDKIVKLAFFMIINGPFTVNKSISIQSACLNFEGSIAEELK